MFNNTYTPQKNIVEVESSKSGAHTLYKDETSGKYYIDGETLPITRDQWDRLFKDS